MTGLVLRLAVRNLGRHRRRTAIVGSGVALGVAAAVVQGALVAGIRRQMIDHLVVSRFGHVTVQAASGGASGDTPAPRIVDPARVSRTIREALPGAEIAPALSSLGMVFGAREGTARVVLNALVRADEIGAGSVWLGAALADRIDASIGEVVTLGTFRSDGALEVEDFTVSHVLPEGAPWEDHFAYVRLEDLARMLDTGSAVDALKLWIPSGPSGASVAARRLQPLLARHEPPLRAETYREAGSLFFGIVRTVRVQAAIVEGILLVAVALTVAGAQIVSVHERRREIGTMAALGTGRRVITSVLLLEGTVLALVAGAVGAAIGGIAVAILARTGVTLEAEAFRWLVGGPAVVPRLEIGAVLATLAGLAAVVTIAGWFPARRAARLLPVDALSTGPA
jgi:putative ABC transport system permease protein